MLSIIVCIKQVPDTQKALFDPEDRDHRPRTVRKHHESRRSPRHGDGPLRSRILRSRNHGHHHGAAPGRRRPRARPMPSASTGCVLISDPRFAGSDSLITGKILSRAIRSSVRFDIVMTGCEAIDGNTSHVGFQLSEFLRIPLLTQIHKFHIEEGHAVIERLYGHEYQKIKSAPPVLLAVGKNANRVRIPRLVDIKNLPRQDDHPS